MNLGRAEAVGIQPDSLFPEHVQVFNIVLPIYQFAEDIFRAFHLLIIQKEKLPTAETTSNFLKILGEGFTHASPKPDIDELDHLLWPQELRRWRGLMVAPALAFHRRVANHTASTGMWISDKETSAGSRSTCF